MDLKDHIAIIITKICLSSFTCMIEALLWVAIQHAGNNASIIYFALIKYFPKAAMYWKRTYVLEFIKIMHKSYKDGILTILLSQQSTWDISDLIFVLCELCSDFSWTFTAWGNNSSVAFPLIVRYVLDNWLRGKKITILLYPSPASVLVLYSTNRVWCTLVSNRIKALIK